MTADRKLVEFLVKVRDGAQQIADAANEYVESLTPPEIKEENAVDENTFSCLKFDAQQGNKLGSFDVAYKTTNPADKWTQAFDVLSKANSTIQTRYHGKNYEFSYWLYGEGKIYRQKLKQGANKP
ncbi:MAG: hypothetical protein ABSF65_05780 [Candidatus Bathyarchaeia archaeon]